MALGWGLRRGEVVETPTSFYLESIRSDLIHGYGDAFPAVYGLCTRALMRYIHIREESLETSSTIATQLHAERQTSHKLVEAKNKISLVFAKLLALFQHVRFSRVFVGPFLGATPSYTTVC